MSCFNGRNGALSVGGVNIAQLTSWDVSQSVDAVECTYMGQSWKDHEAGIASWEGSCEALLDGGAADANSLTIGATVALIFYSVDGDVDNAWTGTAIVTSIENSASLDDMMTVSCSFTGKGELTNTVS